MIRGRRLAIAIAASAALAAPASAQPDGDKPAEGEAAPPAGTKDAKQAKKWQQTGATLQTKGDALVKRGKADEAKVQFENAKTAFEKAIEFGADINVTYDLAVVLDKLGKSDEAYKHLRTVAKAGSGARPDIAKKATAKLDEISMKIGLVTLTIKPDGTTLGIAGKEIGKSPLGEPLVLMPGTYTIAFEAEGFQPKQTEINVEAGSESERTIELEAVEIHVAPPAGPVRDEPVAPTAASGPSKVPLFVGGGSAVALIGVATATGLMAKGQHDTFVGPKSTEAERADAQTQGKKLALVTDICLVGGVAAVGFTAYWFFAKYKPSQKKASNERNARASAKLDVVPWVKLDASGFAVAGSF